MWFFFFKQKTAYEMRISDWSSDVCSSDLLGVAVADRVRTGWRYAGLGGSRPSRAGLVGTGWLLRSDWLESVGACSRRQPVPRHAGDGAGRGVAPRCATTRLSRAGRQEPA